MDRLRIRQRWEGNAPVYRISYRGKPLALASANTLNAWITRLIRTLNT